MLSGIIMHIMLTVNCIERGVMPDRVKRAVKRNKKEKTSFIFPSARRQTIESPCPKGGLR